MNINSDFEDYASTKNNSSGRFGFSEGKLKHSGTVYKTNRDNMKNYMKVETVVTNQTINNTKVKKKVRFRDNFEDVVYIESIKSILPSFRMKMSKNKLDEDEKIEEEFIQKNHKELKNNCTGCCKII
jgi:hypothetical protein